MEEKYLPVVGFDGYYEVSNLGRVKSLSRMVKTVFGKGERRIPERILATPDRGNGYLAVDLRGKDKERLASVHQLVAEAFLPNPENKPQVNHINGVKSDNRLENLEWATPSENAKHNYDKLGRVALRGADDSRSKKVFQYSLGGNLVMTWACAKDAQRDGGFCAQQVSACCRERAHNKSHKGFVFSFSELPLDYFNKKWGAELQKKEVYKKDLQGQILKKYSSLTEAELDGFSSSKISLVAKGRRKTHGGYLWEYA